MKNNLLKLFIKIDKKSILLIAGKIDDQNNIKILDKLILQITGFEKNKITDIEKKIKNIKKNILIIEQKVKFTFKELVIILNNFDISFLNFTGYKIKWNSNF